MSIEKIVVANARGESLPDTLRRAQVFGIEPGDSDAEVATKLVDAAVAANPPVVTSATGQAVTTRALMAAIVAPANGQKADLTEPGFEGTFVFSTADLSAEVAIDTDRKTYIAPSSDTDGSSGAWVRRISADVEPRFSRAAPHADFEFVTDIFTVEVRGPGRASVSPDIKDAFDQLYPISGISSGNVTLYVDPVNGSDSNAGNTLSQAFLTINKANATVGGTVVLLPGFHDIAGTNPDFRYLAAQGPGTHPFGDRPRRFIAPWGRATIGTAGVNLSAATWTASGSNWETTLAGVAGTAPDLARLLRTDWLDAQGLPMPIPKVLTVGDLATTAYGWHYDATTRKVTMRAGGISGNTRLKAQLQGSYSKPSVNNKLLLYSTTSFWDNVDFQVYIDASSFAGQAQCEVWLRNCRFMYSTTYGLLSQGARTFTQGCFAYRTTNDAANYNDSGAFTAKAVEIDFESFQVGDEDSYPGQVAHPIAASAYNKQHSSSHTGDVFRANGRGADCAGPVVQDTAGSKTWMVGGPTGRSLAPAGSGFGKTILMQNNTAWLEAMDIPAGTEGALHSDGATVKVADVLGPRSTENAGTIATYAPVAR